jgi:ribose transport system substrate-binding protein
MKPLIGVSLNIGSHVWYTRQVMAERAAAEAAGYGLEVRDAEDDPARQIAQVGELLEHGIRALLLSATRADAIDEALDACASRGVPVIGESIALAHHAVVAEVRVDDTAAGIPLGAAAARAAVTTDEIPRLTLVGFSSLPEGHDRERGFLEGFRHVHPHVSAVYIDGRAQVPLVRAATQRVIAGLGQAAGRPPHVLFGVDDESVIGALEGYAARGVDTSGTVTATYGISPPSGPARIDDGTITFGAAMFPEWHGEVLVGLALAHLRGEQHARLVHPPSAVVTASGTPSGWDRFYRRVGDAFELDREAVRSLAGGASHG